jgi:hypothetical protein
MNATKNNATRNNRKNLKKNNSRKNNGMNKMGGQHNNKHHGGSGVFSSVVAPFTGAVRLSGNLVGDGLELAVNIPASAVQSVGRTLSKGVRNLASGVGRLGNNAASGVNRTLGRAVGSRRNSRNSRK